MKISFKPVIGFIIITLVLVSCAPAPTPAPTSTHLPPTASPTHAATATPSPFPTLIPTETQIPEPWIDLLAEQRQYAPEGLSLGTRTAEKLKFNPKADQRAIQEQILASQMRQLMIPENRYILDKLLEAHPEWAGTAWNSIANPFELRLQIMNAVMEITGGRLFNKLWPSNTVALWDANQPVQFECEQVQQVPTKPELTLNDGSIAMGVYVNSMGGLVYREEFTKEHIENSYDMSKFPFDFYCSYKMLLYAENQARGYTDWTSIQNGEITFVNYRIFALDLSNPLYLRSPREYREYFLKFK